jgi:hypothetical protein
MSKNWPLPELGLNDLARKPPLWPVSPGRWHAIVVDVHRVSRESLRKIARKPLFLRIFPLPQIKGATGNNAPVLVGHAQKSTKNQGSPARVPRKQPNYSRQ